MDNCLYFNGLEVCDKDFTYCIDMIRLSCQITYDSFAIKILSRKPIYKEKIKEWTSTKITDFQYNFNYTDNTCSFWFGFISNKEKTGKGKSLSNPNTCFNFTVEFNPNKTKDNKLLLQILNLSTNWVVKSCDFAIDIKTNILNINTMFSKSFLFRIFLASYKHL